MTGLTPEQRQLIEQEGTQPVRIEAENFWDFSVVFRSAKERPFAERKATLLSKCRKVLRLIEDPETRQAYMLIRAHMYERVRDILEPKSVLDLEVPAGIRRSQETFWRDLPPLLSQRKLRGRWVCYHGDEWIGIGMYEELIRECRRRGIADDVYYLGRILLKELPPWELEEVEPLGPHHLDDYPTEP